MKKNYIWILISVVSATLVGLIFVQSYWIRNAIDLKEEQFNHIINKSLGNIVKQLQEEETVYYVIKEINSQNADSSGNLSQSIMQGFDSIKILPDKNVLLVHPKKVCENYEFVKPDCLIVKNEKLNDYLTNANQVVTRRNLQERYVSKIRDKTVLVEKVIDKLISHHVKIEERLNTIKLNCVIQKELEDQDIILRTEYAVKDNDGKTVFKSEKYNDTHDSKSFNARLFPDDIMEPAYFLVVYFPTQQNYLFNSLGLMATSSIILTAIVIFIFTITILIIVRQKKFSEIKNDFINNMTHELKTPISTISLASQMIADSSIPNESKNFSQLGKVIMDESKRLAYQVEKVLQMAVFDKVQIKLRLKEIDLNTLIKTIVRNFEIQVSSRNGKLNVSLSAENSIIKADEVHITNVIVNLLDNALKYSKQDPVINISTRNYSKGILMVVEDNGIGISKSDQKRVFERFYRVPTGNIHNVKGFGLGLSYVKKIVDEHKGTITIDSEINIGSTFKIFLPRDINNL